MSCLAFTSACADRAQRQSLFSSGLTRLIINAMRHFPENVIVKWRCCDFIGNVVSSVRGATTDELLTTDAIRTIVEGMRRQPSEEKVVQAGTFALKVIGKLDEKVVRKQLWDEHKVVDMVTPLLKTWRTNLKIRQNVTAILDLARAEQARRSGISLATLVAQEKAATLAAAVTAEQKGLPGGSAANIGVDAQSSGSAASFGVPLSVPSSERERERAERKHHHSNSSGAIVGEHHHHHRPSGHHHSSSSSRAEGQAAPSPATVSASRRNSTGPSPSGMSSSGSQSSLNGLPSSVVSSSQSMNGIRPSSSSGASSSSHMIGSSSSQQSSNGANGTSSGASTVGANSNMLLTAPVVMVERSSPSNASSSSSSSSTGWNMSSQPSGRGLPPSMTPSNGATGTATPNGSGNGHSGHITLPALHLPRQHH
jgi:hypothetical protein